MEQRKKNASESQIGKRTSLEQNSACQAIPCGGKEGLEESRVGPPAGCSFRCSLVEGWGRERSRKHSESGWRQQRKGSSGDANPLLLLHWSSSQWRPADKRGRGFTLCPTRDGCFPSFALLSNAILTMLVQNTVYSIISFLNVTIDCQTNASICTQYYLRKPINFNGVNRIEIHSLTVFSPSPLL